MLEIGNLLRADPIEAFQLNQNFQYTGLLVLRSRFCRCTGKKLGTGKIQENSQLMARAHPVSIIKLNRILFYIVRRS